MACLPHSCVNTVQTLTQAACTATPTASLFLIHTINSPTTRLVPSHTAQIIHIVHLSPFAFSSTGADMCDISSMAYYLCAWFMLATSKCLVARGSTRWPNLTVFACVEARAHIINHVLWTLYMTRTIRSTQGALSASCTVPIRTNQCCACRHCGYIEI